MICRDCKIELQGGYYIQQTCVPCDDAPEGTTWMRFGGSGIIRRCLKCPKCGYSVIV
jgi:hypothetical protein